MRHQYSITRRSFLKQSGALSISALLPFSSSASAIDKDIIIGHGDFKYKIDMNWGLLDKTKFPVNDCHEMVYTRKGNVIMLTNEVKNNVIIYNKDGELLETWGDSYPGAHGLTLSDEGGEEFLYITDTVRHQVIKTDLKGKEVLIIQFPRASVKYNSPDEYLPTETAISASGDIYVADGYGKQNIIHYDNRGRIKNVFGGQGNGVDQFNNAHGIAIDTRGKSERLLITARAQNKLKYFSLAGEYESSIDLDGAFICRPVIKGDNVYLATIWSGDGGPNTGFVSILDKDDKLISAPGGNYPNYTDVKLKGMYQTLQIFSHPHDVCIDEDENIYVCQWNAGKTYPIKLNRV